MKIRSNTGGVVEIGDERAERLLATGHWQTLDAESVSEAPEDRPEGGDPQEPVNEPVKPFQGQERPAAAVVRSWAVANHVDVPAKGRVPESVYEQYADAHKE
jgi:hypothetical protein